MGCQISKKQKNIEKVEKDNNIICEWNADYITQKYHWWPLKQSETLNDNHNNLYAKDGGLDKYDKLFRKKSLKYQAKRHFIHRDSDRSDRDWAGFCDKASILSSLYKYPKTFVTVKCEDREIEFSPLDIEMLMITVCDNTTREGLMVLYGERNNSDKENNYKKKQEPYPLELMEILKRFSKEREPFIMDIDNESAVWNYPYDQFKITEVEKPENNQYLDRIPKTGKNTFLRFQIYSTAYNDKNIDIIGCVNYYGEFIRQVWLCDNNPDFLWKAYGKNEPWHGKSKMNPHIDANVIYKIYQQSILQENKYVLIS
tara:strand:- start:648 stop:1586 length:939 start_codon:yes stop_codon:yes gene_type:complete